MCIRDRLRAAARTGTYPRDESRGAFLGFARPDDWWKGDVYKRQLQGKTDEDLRTFIVEAQDKREPFYSQARYRFDAGYMESRSRISQSVQRLRQLLGL